MNIINADAGLANNKPKTRFTPRELIHHHMENPDEPITDADIENLYLGNSESDISTAEQHTNNAGFTNGRMFSAEDFNK